MRTEIQNIIWDIMKIVKNYLDKEKMPYYMLGGTLLGAVRHKGFIPWDDDIDIGIERENYDKFLQNISSFLPKHLKLRTYENSDDHHYYFSRVVDTRYVIKRIGSEKEREEEVWVDIFPLDGMPNNFFIRLIHMIRLLYVRLRYHLSTFDRVNIKRPNRPFYEIFIINFVKIFRIGQNSDKKIWLKKIDLLLRKYKVKSSNYVVNFMGQYKFKEMFPKSWYGNGKNYVFEEIELYGPIEASKVLSKQYGDYMKIPLDVDKNAHRTTNLRKVY